MGFIFHDSQTASSSGKHTFPLFYEDTDLEDLENIPLKEGMKVHAVCDNATPPSKGR